MGKIAIVGLHNLHLMQFLYKYTNILDKYQIDYDVLYWDRDMDPSIKVKAFKGYAIPFQYKMSNYQPKQKKVLGFLKCLAFMNKTINKNQYDKVILLTTQTALPLFLLNHRVRAHAFVYDYRDLTYEYNGICRRIIQYIIKKSKFTAISSLGFTEILGKSERYVVSHNVSDMDYQKVNHIVGPKIRLVYWGMIRQLDFNKKICDLFGNDLRFELWYHGEGSNKELSEYCVKKGWENVHFTGRYMSSEIAGFAEKTDILLNLYENDRQQRLASTVKLYDGIRFNLPMLISDASYMSAVMKENPAVYSIDLDHTDKEELIRWYKNISVCSGYHYMRELEQIQADDSMFEKNLLSFVNSKSM